MTKHARQFAVREIVQSKRIESQEELVAALRKKGFEVTQATLSRDMHEMNISRVNTPDGAHYVEAKESEDRRLRALLSYEVTSITNNESLVVIKTLSGRAHGVAELIDIIGDKNILATIAGDNTIFVAPKSVKQIPALVKTLREFITTN